MAYEPTDWKNREVERPRTFTLQNNDDGTVTLIPAEGKVTEQGTPIMAVNMNKIENQLVYLDDAFTNMYSVTDGPNAKSFSGDIDNLVEAGLYHCERGTLNTPGSNECLIEVLPTTDAKVVIQYATVVNSNNNTITMKRTGKKEPTGAYSWMSESGPHQIYGWKIENTGLTDSINVNSSTTGASSKAVRDLNVKLDEMIRASYGNPEGVVVAMPGTIYLNKNGGLNTTFYVKISGSGNTGWVAK